MGVEQTAATEQEAAARLEARSLAWLFGIGSTLGFTSLLAPRVAPESELGLVVTFSLGYAVAALFAVGPRRLRPWVFQLALLSGTLMISAAIFFNGQSVADNELLYLWVVLYAFYFLSRPQAVLQLVFVAVAYAAVLSGQGADTDPFVRWMVAVFTFAVVGFFTAVLKERLERLIARLGEQAMTDSLTGLLNRRAFEARIETELERSRRSGSPFSLLVGDLDRFKRLNDLHGHPAGDRALERIGELLTAGRSADVAARIGGEEFALLLPDTGELEALAVAERLRNAVREAFSGAPVPLTISFGVAAFPDRGDSADALLKAADGALYAAKRSGRDRSARPEGDAVAL